MYENDAIDISAPTDPRVVACLSTPTLHRLRAQTNLPRAVLAIDAELAARGLWRGPARWALVVSATALALSALSLFLTLKR